MANKRKFKEIRQSVQEIMKRQPTKAQLDDLRDTFREIERSEKETEQKTEIVPNKKIARDPELGM